MDIKEYISSGIIEQYVMGLCSEDEQKELERLRKQFPELQASILQYETELEERMMKDVKMPAAETDDKILLSLESLQTPVAQIEGKRRIKMMTWLRPVAAASLLSLAVCAYFIYSLNKKTKQLEQELSAIKNNPSSLPAEDFNIMKNPAITPVAMYGVGIHSICRCTMFWDKKTGKLYIMIHHLPPSSSSEDYQLWAMVNDKPVNVGIIKDEIRGRFIEMQNVPGGANSFIVTLENAGGNTTPTTEQTYLSGRI